MAASAKSCCDKKCGMLFWNMVWQANCTNLWFSLGPSLCDCSQGQDESFWRLYCPSLRNIDQQMAQETWVLADGFKQLSGEWCAARVHLQHHALAKTVSRQEGREIGRELMVFLTCTTLLWLRRKGAGPLRDLGRLNMSLRFFFPRVVSTHMTAFPGKDSSCSSGNPKKEWTPNQRRNFDKFIDHCLAGTRYLVQWQVSGSIMPPMTRAIRMTNDHVVVLFVAFLNFNVISQFETTLISSDIGIIQSLQCLIFNFWKQNEHPRNPRTKLEWSSLSRA